MSSGKMDNLIKAAIENWVTENFDEEWKNSPQDLSTNIFDMVNSSGEFWGEWALDKPTSIEGVSKLLDHVGIFNIALKADEL